MFELLFLKFVYQTSPEKHYRYCTFPPFIFNNLFVYIIIWWSFLLFYIAFYLILGNKLHQWSSHKSTSLPQQGMRHIYYMTWVCYRNVLKNTAYEKFTTLLIFKDIKNRCFDVSALKSFDNWKFRLFCRWFEMSFHSTWGTSVSSLCWELWSSILWKSLSWF